MKTAYVLYIFQKAKELVFVKVKPEDICPEGLVYPEIIQIMTLISICTLIKMYNFIQGFLIKTWQASKYFSIDLTLPGPHNEAVCFTGVVDKVALPSSPCC